MSTTPTDAERAQLIERLKNHGRLGHRSISIADVHEAARLLEAARALPVDGLDAERYQFLKPRMLAADFDWQGDGTCVLIFEWPANVPISADCDATIDAAIKQQEPS